MNWLSRIFDPAMELKIGDATALDMRRLAAPCLACGKERIAHHDGHEYALIASQIATKDHNDLLRFFELFKGHRWSELSEIQEFDGNRNAALIYAVKCTEGMTVYAVRDPVELWDSSSVIDAVVLSGEEAAELLTLPVKFKEI